MPLIPIIDEAKVKKLTDEPKFGTVVDNNDPDQLGKIKVVIPGIFEGTTETLPWIRRKNDTSFCGDDAELFDVPAVGSVVEVKWNYDENTPMYSGAPNSKKHTSKVFTNNYPHEGGIRFGKCYIKFDKATNMGTLTNGKAYIQFDPMGNITIIGSGAVNISSPQAINLTAPTINLKGNTEVDGNLVCTKAASGTITPINPGVVTKGIVTAIK